jgi:predicted dehydrogenase
MIGILGSGFGLYGYLPAAVKCTDDKIALLQKSFDVFKKRKELQFCEPRIFWCKDQEELIALVDTIVLCVPPQIQREFCEKWISLENIENVILEKPIAENPKLSMQVLNIAEKKNIRVGYTFGFTDWSVKLKDLIQNENKPVEKIIIKWTFKAYHYKNNLANWKRFHEEGGGVLRFYGIHLIALLQSYGYSSVDSSITEGFSENDIYKWEACFRNNSGLPTISVEVNCNSDESIFLISAYTGTGFLIYKLEQKDPFGSNDHTQIDLRVNLLEKLICSLKDASLTEKAIVKYKKTNDLWSIVEKANLFSQKSSSQ